MLGYELVTLRSQLGLLNFQLRTFPLLYALTVDSGTYQAESLYALDKKPVCVWDLEQAYFYPLERGEWLPGSIKAKCIQRPTFFLHFSRKCGCNLTSCPSLYQENFIQQGVPR